jgi:hypothetical protein
LYPLERQSADGVGPSGEALPLQVLLVALRRFRQRMQHVVIKNYTNLRVSNADSLEKAPIAPRMPNASGLNQLSLPHLPPRCSMAERSPVNE